MQLIRYRPAPPFNRYIECFWWSHRKGPLDYSEHMLPSGTAQLVFALHEAPILCRPSASGASIAWSGSIVQGPQSSYYVAGPKPGGGAAGVSFRPGAAGAVLGASIAELADRHVALDAIWGRRGVDLHHRLMSASGPADGSSSARVAEIQRASGFSPRHFIALFRSAVGFNPKHYYRIRRFNSAVQSLAARRGRGLTDIAAAAGYSDQAHMTREFREFAGVAPTQYLPSGVDRPLHHRVAAGPGSAGK